MGPAADPAILDPPRVPENLIGRANELPACIEGEYCLALVDTGSQVTTLAAGFYNKHFSSTPLHDCQDLVRVEGAGGGSIPYLGYIFVKISLPGTEAVDVPVLVVNDTKYHNRVPLLVGTNFLHQVDIDKPEELPKCLDVALKAMRKTDEYLEKNDGVYGTVYAPRQCRLEPGEVKTICGNVRVSIPIVDGVALVSSEDKSSTTTVTPTLVPVKKKMKTVSVELFNSGTTSMIVKKGEVLGRLQKVSIEHRPEDQASAEQAIKDSILQQVDLSQLEEDATPEEVQEVKDFISSWEPVFSRDTADIGKTDVITHRIDLVDETPVREKARRIPPPLMDELRQHLRQLQEMGVIEESSSAWCSPVVLVRKKCGDLRVCVDYRFLNAKTKKDSYRIPSIEELIDMLGGSTWFATLDVSASYHQVEIDPQHRERTAFTVGPLGFFQYRRMPYGLTNAPATYQRMMEKVLAGVHLKTALCYLDDVIVFGRSPQELKERLDEVLRRIHGANLKLKLSKCKFFFRKLKYLGHVVSGQGVETDPEMIEPVKTWKVPSCVKDVQKFLGFANFFRKFIKGFGSISQPLTQLTGGMKKVDLRKKGAVPDFKWEARHQEAFDKLREALTSAPVLSYPQFDKPFIVRTDASTSGLGAVLCQDQGDRAGPCVIAYASRCLKPSERNYSPYKLEFLAMYWAITKKFSSYLGGNKEFVVTTDHNPLTYVLGKAKLDAAGHRWLAELMQYNFCIRYKPGAANTDADALSRLHEETITSEAVRATCRALCDHDDFQGYAKCMLMRCPSEETEYSVQVSAVSATLDGDPVNWAEEQSKDEVLARLKRVVDGSLCVDEKTEVPAMKRWLKEIEKLVLRDGVLYRTPQDRPRQILLPVSLKGLVLSKTHDEMGHQGRDRTLSLCRDRFYWLSMSRDVEDYVRSCERCTRGKAPHVAHRAPLKPITSSGPLDLVCIDFLGLETSKGGYSSILVLTDHFTRLSMAIPTTNQKASTVAKLLQSHWFYNVGIPRRLHSDQGGSFQADIIKNLCKSHGIKQSRTSSYHPEGNGMTERFNSTLLNMLRTLDEPQKADWKSHVNRLVHAYNCTTHTSTGYSPYYLMHGRHPRLPVDALIGPESLDEEPDYDDYIDNIREQLKMAYRLASARSKVASASQKEGYDKKVRGGAPEVGDLVLVRKLGVKGKHKIMDKFEREVYVILAKEEGVPVYRVQREDGKGSERVLHRNHLLPVVWPLPDAVNEAIDADEKQQHTKQPGKRKLTGVVDTSHVFAEEEDSSDEEPGGLVVEISTSEQAREEPPLIVSPPVITGEPALYPVYPHPDVPLTDCSRQVPGDPSGEVVPVECNSIPRCEEEHSLEQKTASSEQPDTTENSVQENTTTKEHVPFADDVHAEVSSPLQEPVQFEEAIAVPQPESPLDLESFQDCEPSGPAHRPRRHCKPVDRYGDPISYSQQACITGVTTDWMLRVQYLASLIVLYPHLEEQLLGCIMKVVTTL